MSRQQSVLALVSVVLIGWTAGASAQTASAPMKIPPLPPADGTQAAEQAIPQQQASPPQQAADAADTRSTTDLPPLPLDHDGIREVQLQLIALGFDPGPADGETGPATLAAVQQYNESRGGTGRIPVDGRLLARLQQDTGPRLTPAQVTARSQPSYQAQAPANPAAGLVQQFESNLRGLLNGGH